MSVSPELLFLPVSVRTYVCSFGQEKCLRSLYGVFAASSNGYSYTGPTYYFPKLSEVSHHKMRWIETTTFNEYEGVRSVCLPPAQEWAWSFLTAEQKTTDKEAWNSSSAKFRVNVECNLSRQYREASGFAWNDVVRFTEKCAEIIHKNPKRPCAVKSVHPAEILAARLHDMNAARNDPSRGHIYVVFEDGEICFTKCGDLLWQRSLHMDAPGLDNFFKGCELPYKSGSHSCALVKTQEEAYQIRNALRIDILHP